MTDEIVLEDIFEIGERLLDEGVDPSAVVCCRGVLEWFHGRYGYFPLVRSHGDGAQLEIKVENYWWEEIFVKPASDRPRSQQIIGWSTYKGKVDKKEDGEVYYEAGESWYHNLDDFIGRRTRRHYRRGVVG